MEHGMSPLVLMTIAALLLLGGFVRAAAPEPEQAPATRGSAAGALEPPSLTVTGQGEASADPDLAVVRLGATVQAQEASRAQEQVNEIMKRATQAVRDRGVGEKQIGTAGISLSPVYSQPRPPRVDEAPEAPRIVGYRASNVLRIEVTNLSNVGKVIDAGVGAGANEIQGVSFELTNDADAKGRALRAAARSARAKADALADATGVHLASVYEISESGVSFIPPPAPRYRMAAMAVATETPVQPGQVRVEANVTIRYRITKTAVNAGPEAAAPAPAKK